VAYALICAGFFKERLHLRFSPRVWDALSVIAVVVCGMAIFRTLSVPTPLVYFLVYLKINKCWNQETSRDCAWLFSLCLFEVVLATLFTTSLTLLFVIVGFVLSFTVALILYSCKVEIDRAKGAGATLSGGKFGVGDAKLSKGFMASCLAVGLGIVFATAIIFPLVPRPRQTRILGAYGQRPNRLLSGFSDDVRLGSVSSIQKDPAIVMRVYPLDAESLRYFFANGLRLRGLSLRDFDGKHWTNTRYYMGRGGERSFQGNAVGFRRPNDTRPNLNVRIYIEPYFTDYLFMPVAPVSLQLPEGMILACDEESESVRFARPISENISYHAASVMEPDPRAALQGRPPRPGAMSALLETAAVLRKESLAASQPGYRRPGNEEEKEIDLALSRLMGIRARGGVMDNDFPGRLPRYLAVYPGVANSREYQVLVEQMRGWNLSGYDLAHRVENWIRSNFEYSLNPETQLAGDEPLLYFLFTSKKGHCELFATSMAMLLRSLGIPARMVNGFVTTEWNPVSGHFIVRQENAHSWVEAWIQGYGWKTFDPTPPGAVINAQGRGRNWLAYRAWQYYEALRFRWYRYVVDYGTGEQRSALEWCRDFLGGLRSDAALVWALVCQSFSYGYGNSFVRVTVLWLTTVILAIVTVFFAISSRPRRSIAVQLQAAGARPSVIAAVELYDLILRRLERLGYRRRICETPAEFAQAIVEQDPSLDKLPAVTGVYYHARYGRADLDDEETAAMRELADELRAR